MNLKCLIQLLEEKEYIEVENIYGAHTQKLIGYDIKSKYDEVIDKIEETVDKKQSNNIATYRRKGFSTNEYWICYIPKLIEDIEEFFNIINKETGRYCCINITNIPSLSDEISEKTSEYYTWKGHYCGGCYITNKRRRQERIQKENNKKAEVINFIQSLP